MKSGGNENASAIDWESLARPSLRGLERYSPGASRAELVEQLGLTELVPLHWNEDMFGPPEWVFTAAAAELENASLYPEGAFARFRDAIAGYVDMPTEAIVPAHGAQALINVVTSVFVDPGTAVVVPSLTYGLYSQVCSAAGAEVTVVPHRDLAIDLDGLADAARRTSARLVWVCDPNNPTGLTIGRDEWNAFLDRLPDRCVVVADEAYGDYVDPDVRVRRELDVSAGRPVIVIRSFSKLFGLAGLRLGYAIADPELAALLDIVQEPFNVNRIALAAGTAALSRPGFVAERRAEVAEARGALIDAVTAEGIRAVPAHANFVLFDLGVDDGEVVDALLRRGLAVRGGAGFGLPGYVRITVAPVPVMERVARELVDVVAQLRS